MQKVHIGIVMIFLFMVSSTGCGRYYSSSDYYNDYYNDNYLKCYSPEIGENGVPEMICTRDGYLYRYRGGAWYQNTEGTDSWIAIPRPTFATHSNACETLGKEFMVDAMTEERMKKQTK